MRQRAGGAAPKPGARLQPVTSSTVVGAGSERTRPTSDDSNTASGTPRRASDVGRVLLDPPGYAGADAGRVLLAPPRNAAVAAAPAGSAITFSRSRSHAIASS